MIFLNTVHESCITRWYFYGKLCLCAWHRMENRAHDDDERKRITRTNCCDGWSDVYFANAMRLTCCLNTWTWCIEMNMPFAKVKERYFLSWCLFQIPCYQLSPKYQRFFSYIFKLIRCWIAAGVSLQQSKIPKYNANDA